MGAQEALLAQVGAMQVTNDEEYRAAGELARQVKAAGKKAEEYWEPLRSAAWTAYQAVMERRKQMMGPFAEAEKTIKAKMGAFTRARQEAARARQEAVRMEALKAAEKARQEAAMARERGDNATADWAETQAEVLEGMQPTAVRPAEAEGIRHTKTWRIVSVDPSLVPTSVNGVEIRPVDTAAVMKLIRQSRGTVRIPGITFEEDYTISVRT